MKRDGYRIPDSWQRPQVPPEGEPISKVMAWIVLAACIAAIVACAGVSMWWKA